MSIVAD